MNNIGTRHPSPLRAGLTPWIALIAALIAAFVIFHFNNVTPQAMPATASALEFSAERAMAGVRAIAPVPHPVGSPANDKVRDHLVSRLKALGLSTQVQRGSSFQASGANIYGGTIENVIGVLPGLDASAPALALMAHRDSVAGSPGAADDAAGIASALEIVRAIQAKGTPLRDVIVLLTDGEEAGLLGARVFFEESPLSKHIGYVINMETRGGGGRAAMFETGPDNGADIDLYRRTAWQAESNALTVFVYKHMPNDTDFTVAQQHGKPGLNYAFIGRQFDYHSPSSTPDALDIGSLQHMGAQVLPTALALAFGPLPERAPDVVYGNLLAGIVPAYPTGFGWIVLLAAAAMVAVGAARAWRKNALLGADIARGAGTAFYVIALGGALLELTRRATGVESGWMAYRPILARFATFELMMLAAALGAVLVAAALASRTRSRWLAAGLPLVAGLAASLFNGFDLVGLVLGTVGAVVGALTFGTPARIAGTWTCLLLVALITTLALQITAPLVAYVIAWPLLAAALASALSAAGSDRRWRVLLTIGVIASLALAWLGGLFHALLQGLDVPLLAVVPTWLACLVMWPLAQGKQLLRCAFVVIAAGLLIAGYLHLTNPWTARHPKAVEPVYVVDPAVHLAWRASLLATDDWTRGVLTAEGGALAKLSLPFADAPIDAAAAQAVDAQPAQASLSTEANGRVTLRFAVPPGAASIILSLQSAGTIDQLTINGKPVRLEAREGRSPYLLSAGQRGRITWQGLGGATLSFHAAAPETLRIQTAAVYDQWLSPKPLPPIPADAQPWDRAGSTFVLGKATGPQHE